ncbi:endolytic transglycosylase MltG [Acidimangrovimonas sediminis]|uniref:endolytic transglycosylase MltG n=1 Tax=Acidimangrovimonas sediminis TaxID=2056283 RepID=UPI000C7F9F83|nr:endolytic transglycosylase MltG [Acidimangrovimonas sediminis]
MGRSVASNALTFFVLLLVAIAGFLEWSKQQYTGPGPLTQPICLRVEKGESVTSLSDKLMKDGAISHAMIFRVGASYADKTDKIKFGSYLVPEHASMQGILGIVTKGGQSTCGTEVNYRIGVTASEMVVRELDPVEGKYQEVAKFDPASKDKAPAEYAKVVAEPDTRFRVILAEGVTSYDVSNALGHADFLSGKIATTPKEGSLAPDSYEVTKEEDRAKLIEEMQGRQAKILKDAWDQRDEDLPYKTPEEALTMASLVEKETGVPGERPEVASVFVNRLNKGMRLQTDPAVIYGITKGKGVLGRGLRQSELKRKTPYNTYEIDGLPPTPICNPGKSAIEAALHPADTKYLYFVANGTGGHAFSDTLAAHNANVAKWRALEAERAKEGKAPSADSSTGTGVSSGN